MQVTPNPLKVSVENIANKTISKKLETQLCGYNCC